jgi:hypothetical protein
MIVNFYIPNIQKLIGIVKSLMQFIMADMPIVHLEDTSRSSRTQCKSTA